MTAESPPSITQRLHRVHLGDTDALRALVTENLPWIEAHVRRRLTPQARGYGDTQDYVQEALLEALRDGPRFSVENPAACRALLARIVENNVVDRIRWLQRGRRDRRRERALPTDSVLALDAPQRAVTETPERADKNEQQAWLRLALELLDPDDREVIQLRDWDGLTFPELGKRLDVSEEAARKRYLRALPKLAQKLDRLRQGQWHAELPAAEPDQDGGASNRS
jgi:RNA polymerase sigma-70 factor (ECF subfamily)